jgi:lipoprotein-anchoring transpeptidase ErfK/SrfK
MTVIGAGVAALLAGLWIATQHTPGLAPAGRSAPLVAASAAPPDHPVARHPVVRAKPVDHCAHNRARRLVLVSIRDQHAWLCARGRTVYSTAVTTGMRGAATATPTGHFRIETRQRDTVLHPSSGGAYPVRYWITFDAPMYGFHDASWQTIPFGSRAYRTGGSHGCVHLPLKAVRFLYGWARVGTPVLIRA